MNFVLITLLFKDHLSRVSGLGKLFSSNPLFYLLIIPIVHPEPSSLSHLSKPYNCPSPALSLSSSYPTFIHPIMPKPNLAWERALASSKIPSTMKQKQEMKGRVFNDYSPGNHFLPPPLPYVLEGAYLHWFHKWQP